MSRDKLIVTPAAGGEQTRNNNIQLGECQDIMTSPESTSDSSWNTTGVPTVIATDDAETDPGSIPPRHQTSLLGIDIHPGITDDLLARPAQYNQEYLAATSD